MKQEITQTGLKMILDYNPETGDFIRTSKHKRWGGTKAGHLNAGNGYVNVMVNNRYYKAHRLAFLWMTGAMPEFVDHINGVRHDNRWENLRAATKAQNCQNKNSKKGLSGIKGVHWHSQHKKWYVGVTVSGKNKFIGLFEDLEAAELVAILAREKYHGEFANHG